MCKLTVSEKCKIEFNLIRLQTILELDLEDSNKFIIHDSLKCQLSEVNEALELIRKTFCGYFK